MTDLKEQAKQFAISAHRGQVRKSEKEKPMILHPLNVGKILEEFGYDEAIIVAAYLHDVVEDTKYSIEEIESIFGSEVARLVKTASELDKTLPWEERKKEAIEKTRDLELREKLVICADKIDNLEDLKWKFQRTGQRDFSTFRAGEEQQKWYYTEMYESLVHGQDENWPIFKRLKDDVERVFYGKEDEYLRENFFEENPSGYEIRKRLHAQKEELKKLKAFSNLKKPFVIEFSGTPRTGKTSVIKSFTDFLTKGGFSVEMIEEFTTSKYYKENIQPLYQKGPIQELYLKINEEVSRELEHAQKTGKDVIIIDRSLNDRQIWNDRGYHKGQIQEEIYQELQETNSNLSKEYIDFLILTYTDPLTALKRDYRASLALEKRRFINEENLREYNESLRRMRNRLNNNVKKSLFLDTTSIGIEEETIQIASEILPAIRKRYLRNIEQIYR